MNFHDFKKHYANSLNKVENQLKYVADEDDRNHEIVAILAKIITTHAAKWVWVNKGMLVQVEETFVDALISGFAFSFFVDCYHKKFEGFSEVFIQRFNQGASYEEMERIVLKGIGVIKELGA